MKLKSVIQVYLEKVLGSDTKLNTNSGVDLKELFKDLFSDDNTRKAEASWSLPKEDKSIFCKIFGFNGKFKVPSFKPSKSSNVHIQDQIKQYIDDTALLFKRVKMDKKFVGFHWIITEQHKLQLRTKFMLNTLFKNSSKRLLWVELDRLVDVSFGYYDSSRLPKLGDDLKFYYEELEIVINSNIPTHLWKLVQASC